MQLASLCLALAGALTAKVALEILGGTSGEWEAIVLAPYGVLLAIIALVHAFSSRPTPRRAALATAVLLFGATMFSYVPAAFGRGDCYGGLVVLLSLYFFLPLVPVVFGLGCWLLRLPHEPVS